MRSDPRPSQERGLGAFRRAKEGDMKPSNKPNKPLSPEWIYFIRIIAAVALSALVSNKEPEVVRALLLEVVKSLML